MTREELIIALTQMQNAARVNRDRVCQLVMQDESNLEILLQLCFEVNNKLSIKACWILEFVCKENLNWILPHLSYFTQNLSTVKYDSAKRPVAKICELLAEAYYSKKESLIKPALKPEYKERIISACFDWMIQKEKIAVHAYSMQCLNLFGRDEAWIHPELRQILLDNMAFGSCGYVARAKRILKEIA
jgi:hypothetical protein